MITPHAQFSIDRTRERIAKRREAAFATRLRDAPFDLWDEVNTLCALGFQELAWALLLSVEPKETT